MIWDLALWYKIVDDRKRYREIAEFLRKWKQLQLKKMRVPEKRLIFQLIGVWLGSVLDCFLQVRAEEERTLALVSVEESKSGTLAVEPLEGDIWEIGQVMLL